MTHDAKRSADVRARIGALASLPRETTVQWQRFAELTEGLRADGAPDDVERYLIFQTLLGAWPIEAPRLEGYLEKALREAKRNTSWVTQDETWEAAVKRFCAAMVEGDWFQNQFGEFLGQVQALGTRATLGQLALKLTAPGIPDIYQGDELDFRALVDPDNRRPVDWNLRRAALAQVRGGGKLDDGAVKLKLIVKLLGLRRERPAAFAGSYEPLDAGPAACAFMRGGEVVTIVQLPRAGFSGTSTLVDAPDGRWRDALSGAERSFTGGERIADLVSESGFAVYKRL